MERIVTVVSQMEMEENFQFIQKAQIIFMEETTQEDTLIPGSSLSKAVTVPAP